MPLQQIAVVSPRNRDMDDQADGHGEETRNPEYIEMDAKTDNARLGDKGNSVAEHKVDNHLVDCDTSTDCDNNSVSDATNVDTGELRELGDIQEHVEADTVIIGDRESESTLSSDGGHETQIHVQVARPGTDTTAQDTLDISNSGNATNRGKKSRSSGKSLKKEKLSPIKKKDSGTQETMHVNSPTPLPAERCDSSMSNMDVCRICQCDSCEIQKESPLVAPCLCSGSLKYIHQACLQKWIKSSDKMSCELCQFDYQMTKKTKPFREWERLDMTPAERRKVVCSVTFHVIAITCVVWSLYVLIDRTTEEVEAGSLLWPFWTKLIVVAIGFTGGVVFMYVQCKMYLNLCKKWRTYNKVILVSSISEAQRERANHEGIVRMTEKQAQLEEERRGTNFDVFTIVQET